MTRGINEANRFERTQPSQPQGVELTTIEHGPFAVMSGAPWNVLDSRGCRIACCGGDSNADWERFGPAIATAIVAALNWPAEADRRVLVGTVAKQVARIAELEAQAQPASEGELRAEVERLRSIMLRTAATLTPIRDADKGQQHANDMVATMERIDELDDIANSRVCDLECDVAELEARNTAIEAALTDVGIYALAKVQHPVHSRDDHNAANCSWCCVYELVRAALAEPPPAATALPVEQGESDSADFEFQLGVSLGVDSAKPSRESLLGAANSIVKRLAAAEGLAAKWRESMYLTVGHCAAELSAILASAKEGSDGR